MTGRKSNILDITSKKRIFYRIGINTFTHVEKEKTDIKDSIHTEVPRDPESIFTGQVQTDFCSWIVSLQNTPTTEKEIQ